MQRTVRPLVHLPQRKANLTKKKKVLGRVQLHFLVCMLMEKKTLNQSHQEQRKGEVIQWGIKSKDAIRLFDYLKLQEISEKL